MEVSTGVLGTTSLLPVSSPPYCKPCRRPTTRTRTPETPHLPSYQRIVSVAPKLRDGIVLTTMRYRSRIKPEHVDHPVLCPNVSITSNSKLGAYGPGQIQSSSFCFESYLVLRQIQVVLI